MVMTGGLVIGWMRGARSVGAGVIVGIGWDMEVELVATARTMVGRRGHLTRMAVGLMTVVGRWSVLVRRTWVTRVSGWS